MPHWYSFMSRWTFKMNISLKWTSMLADYYQLAFKNIANKDTSTTKMYLGHNQESSECQVNQ